MFVRILLVSPSRPLTKDHKKPCDRLSRRSPVLATKERGPVGQKNKLIRKGSITSGEVSGQIQFERRFRRDSIRKLEKAVGGCPNIPCWKGFSGKFQCCSNTFPRFSGSTTCFPCQGLGHFPARKMAAGKLAPPSGMVLDFLLRDRQPSIECFCEIATKLFQQGPDLKLTASETVNYFCQN